MDYLPSVRECHVKTGKSRKDAREKEVHFLGKGQFVFNIKQLYMAEFKDCCDPGTDWEGSPVGQVRAESMHGL